VREAIVNAVTHRDYTSNASVQVMLFADRLEVWNPGELPPTLTIAALRLPHASIPHSPLIAEPMFLATYAEKAGSGILDMIKLCRAAGVRAPDFRQDAGQFVQTIWRPKTVHALAGSAQVTEQVTEQVGRLLTVLQKRTLKGTEVMEKLGLLHRPTFVYSYVQPAMERGLVEMTIPDKPRSRLQQYRLTDKGRTWLTTQEGKTQKK